MKNITKVAITIFCLFFLSSNAFSQGFNSVYSTDGFFVIAVGNGGNVFMSYDGGTTFGYYPQASANLRSVYSVGTKVIIVGDNGLVKVSNNGGNSYTDYAFGSNNLMSVHLADANTGWAVGSNGTIGKTVNGGTSWTAQTSGTGVTLNSVKFTDANNGVACGNGGVVVYTTNGGTSWSPYSTGTTMDLLSVDKSGTTIIATGRDGWIFKYNGTTWSGIDYKSLAKPEIRAVEMIDANNFFTAGGSGFINRTSNGGISRVYQANPMMATLSSMCMFNSLKGWAVSSTMNGILRTADGGGTWQFQNGVSVNFSYTQKQSAGGNIGNPFCMHPKNKNAAFILTGTTLRRTMDKGETWTTLNASVPGSSCHSFFINSVDTNLMIAAMGSSNGRVIVSTNYGTTWTNSLNPINLTSYGMPLQMDYNSPNTVWLAPDNAPLRKSTDWGTTWTLLSGGEGGTFRSPCDVIVQFENSNIVLIGDGTTGSGSGKMWKSTDGGTIWSLINTVSGSEIPMITNTPLDLNLIYHSTWSSGSFWKSQDAGSNFTNLNQSGSLWATDMAQDDPTAVCYDQYGSQSYVSTDAGSTFTQVNVGSSPAAGILYLDKANLLLQHGGGVYKLNISYTVTTVTSNGNNSNGIPQSFGLAQNFPNPFNPTTKIEYNVSKSSFVQIKVYDILGKEVKSLVSSQLNPGTYSYDFNASDLTSGAYFYTMFADGQKIDTKKLLLVK